MLTYAHICSRMLTHADACGRGSGVNGFLLLEGDPKHTSNCTVYGLNLDRESEPLGKACGSSVVQDEDHYKELLAWLVLTDKSLGGFGPGSVRALQTKDMEESLALLSALSICAAFEAQVVYTYVYAYIHTYIIHIGAGCTYIYIYIIYIYSNICI
jgi:hypothetical protein